MVNFFWNGEFGRLHSRNYYNAGTGGVDAPPVFFWDMN